MLLRSVFREVELHYIEAIKREINAIIAVDIQEFVCNVKSNAMKSETVCMAQ